MSQPSNTLNSLRSFQANGKPHRFYSLPALAESGYDVRRFPVSLRIVLESLLRNCDGKRVSEASVRALAGWKAKAERTDEVPFVVSRIILQDFTGVPLLVDLAAMRAAAKRAGKNPKIIEPVVPVDLVVDHSVQVDVNGTADAFARNLDIEFHRNRERYQFLKWGMQAFDTFKIVPPGIGIVHQVNLEYLAKGVLTDPAGICYPDTLVGTDSHTTMINGLGVVGWGVGGIEAEAGMLGQPVYILTPDVVGVHMTGALREGVTATDLVLSLTQFLRKTKVVGKFVEYFGSGAASLGVVDRATIGNMSPEYGATIGYFPMDEKCTEYLRATGRSEEHVALYEAYYRAQGLWGMPEKGQIDYSQEVEFDLGSVTPSVAGPRRPQDRIELPKLKETFIASLTRPLTEGGFGLKEAEKGKHVTVKSKDGVLFHDGGGCQELNCDQKPATKGTNAFTELEMVNNRPTSDPTGAAPKVAGVVSQGSVLIAAITSCTNTSNPSVMLAAGLLAKKAVEHGLKVNPLVKASLAPGSRVVSDYLKKAGLQTYLDQLGFNLVGYGCTTCIGNSGPLNPAIEDVVVKENIVSASVLSGNRNFEARIHQNIKANFLMSPPLVVAFALAGRVDIDMNHEPLGRGTDGRDVFLKDIWPSSQEVRQQMQATLRPEVYRKYYTDFEAQNPKWNEISSTTGDVYAFDPSSTYIQEPPFFADFALKPESIAEIKGARALALFGDSVTTDHISPAGAIKKSSPAGRYLLEHGVEFADFNSYGSRRGNDRVMTRGTFANVRIKNLMAGGKEGGYAIGPDGKETSIYEAALAFQKQGTPLVVIAGQEYGTGSSRDWAAKGTTLLGVKAVVAQSYERIHRSNLIGMGVLPLQFKEGTSAKTLQLDGHETYDVLGLDDHLQARRELTLKITRRDGTSIQVPVLCRIDTPIEVDYYRHGGILHYVLRQQIARH